MCETGLTRNAEDKTAPFDDVTGGRGLILDLQKSAKVINIVRTDTVKNEQLKNVSGVRDSFPDAAEQKRVIIRSATYGCINNDFQMWKVGRKLFSFILQ